MEYRREKEFSRPLKVYYGWRKLTKKAVRRPQLLVLYENSDGNYERKSNVLHRMMPKITHVRNQSEKETEDAYYKNREFTSYGFFIDDRKIKGDIEIALQLNFEADSNHVSTEEREEIRNKLRESYKYAYR